MQREKYRYSGEPQELTIDDQKIQLVEGQEYELPENDVQVAALVQSNELTLIKTYPTEPDQDGYYFENEDEEQMEVRTKKYENGNRVKIYNITNGNECVTRELNGHDAINAQMQSKDKKGNPQQEKYMASCAASATKVNGKDISLPELLAMKLRDYNTITAVNNMLNFS